MKTTAESLIAKPSSKDCWPTYRKMRNPMQTKARKIPNLFFGEGREDRERERRGMKG